MRKNAYKRKREKERKKENDVVSLINDCIVYSLLYLVERLLVVEK